MGLTAQSYKVRAYLLANLFYSVLHFVRPGNAYFLDSLDLSAGFRHLGYIFTPFLDPLSFCPECLDCLSSAPYYHLPWSAPAICISPLAYTRDGCLV